MFVLVIILSLTAAFFFAQKMLRRSGPGWLLVLFGLVPLLLTPYWFLNNNFDAFLWIKIYSIMFCVCWGSLLRFSRLGESGLARHTISLLLAGNVLEALVVDLLGGSLANWLNAFAGALLLATIPYGSRGTSVDTNSPENDLRFGIKFRWIVGYSVWNWTFVYLNYPEIAGHHLAVLGAALIVGAIDPARWLQTRAATLGISLFFMATSYSGMLSVLDTSNWLAPGFGTVLATGSCCLMIGVALAPRFGAPTVNGINDINLPLFSDQRIVEISAHGNT